MTDTEDEADVVERARAKTRLLDAALCEMADEITALRSENEALREALKPFAATADRYDQIAQRVGSMIENWDASAGVVGWKYVDAVAARAALQSPPLKEKEALSVAFYHEAKDEGELVEFLTDPNAFMRKTTEGGGE